VAPEAAFNGGQQFKQLLFNDRNSDAAVTVDQPGEGAPVFPVHERKFLSALFRPIHD
jgi:hypothetical protein